MSKLNDGIILEDCLISFMLLSTFLLLMSLYLADVYKLQADIVSATNQINSLKICMLNNCALSHGNNVREVCTTYVIKNNNKEVCIEI